MGNLDGVGVVWSLRDDTWPVGSVSDGIVCGHSFCTLSGRHCDSSEELIVLEGLFVWGDEMKVDADVLFNDTLSKVEGGCCLSLRKAVRLLMAG